MLSIYCLLVLAVVRASCDQANSHDDCHRLIDMQVENHTVAIRGTNRDEDGVFVSRLDLAVNMSSSGGAGFTLDYIFANNTEMLDLSLFFEYNLVAVIEYESPDGKPYDQGDRVEQTYNLGNALGWDLFENSTEPLDAGNIFSFWTNTTDQVFRVRGSISDTVILPDKLLSPNWLTLDLQLTQFPYQATNGTSLAVVACFSSSGDYRLSMDKIRMNATGDTMGPEGGTMNPDSALEGVVFWAPSATAVAGSVTAVTGSATAVAGSVTAVAGSATAVTGSVTAVTGSATAVTGSVTAVTGSATAVAGRPVTVTATFSQDRTEWCPDHHTVFYSIESTRRESIIAWKGVSVGVTTVEWFSWDGQNAAIAIIGIATILVLGLFCAAYVFRKVRKHRYRKVPRSAMDTGGVTMYGGQE